MAKTNELRVESVSRTTVSTMGDEGAIIFNLENGGEISLHLPFEVVADAQVALAHVQRALVFKRQALGAGESPNLLFVQSIRARDLPDRQLHLQVNTEDGIPFHFHVSSNMARSLASALSDWLQQHPGPAAA